MHPNMGVHMTHSRMIFSKVLSRMILWQTDWNVCCCTLNIHPSFPLASSDVQCGKESVRSNESNLMKW